jgi:hypothetical protein
MKLKSPKSASSLEETLIKHYSGELPQSDFHHSSHLKWIMDDPDNWLSRAKAYSKVLDVYWEIDLDTDGGLVLYLNDMRVGTGSYNYPSIPRSLAERAEDAMRKDITAYLRIIELIEQSRKLK